MMELDVKADLGSRTSGTARSCYWREAWPGAITVRAYCTGTGVVIVWGRSVGQHNGNLPYDVRAETLY